ncbi:hypothetical protein KXD40_007332 [Peronospora effusa]|nr:hypothetical protein KXD40_007332 [Peronospora effusa]
MQANDLPWMTSLDRVTTKTEFPAHHRHHTFFAELVSATNQFTNLVVYASKAEKEMVIFRRLGDGE